VGETEAERTTRSITESPATVWRLTKLIIQMYQSIEVQLEPITTKKYAVSQASDLQMSKTIGKTIAFPWYISVHGAVWLLI